jgi:hypothetical protein
MTNFYIITRSWGSTLSLIDYFSVFSLVAKFPFFRLLSSPSLCLSTACAISFKFMPLKGEVLFTGCAWVRSSRTVESEMRLFVESRHRPTPPPFAPGTKVKAVKG